MPEYRPDYYSRFRCLASECKETCCAGWEIDIDPESAARYRGLSGPFGERLRQGIDWGSDPPCFRLKGERCVFLTPENLCEIYINCGEDALCAICSEHPRFHEQFGGHKESGLGLCCEAAAALILDTAAPAQFVLLDSPEEGGEEPPLFRPLFAARERAFRIVQDRARPFGERMARLLEFGTQIQDQLDEGLPPDPDAPVVLPEGIAEEDALFSLCGGLLSLLLELEPFDPRWPGRIEELCARLPGVLAARCSRDAAYENLAVYFLFRYLLKSVHDGDFLSKIKLAALLTLTILLLDGGTLLDAGTLSPEDRLRSAAACSRELEYSEENIAALEEACVWEEEFSLERMEAAFSAL